MPPWWQIPYYYPRGRTNNQYSFANVNNNILKAPHSCALTTRWCCFPHNMHQSPPPPLPPILIPIPIPTLTFMEPLEGGEASTSSQRRNAGRGGWKWEEVEWKGGLIRAVGGRGGVRRWGCGVVVKVARYGIEGKVSRHISQLLL